jgi:excisionase family DNA binding protein
MQKSNSFDRQSELVLLTNKHRQLSESITIQPEPTAAPVQPFFENRIVLSLSEVASSLGLSPKSIERMIKRGELKSKRVGRRVLIPKSEVETWLTRKE